MDAWVTHCKGRYPREFATPTRLRSPILNDDQLTVLVKTYTDGHHCYISAYSFDLWERINNKKLNYDLAVIDTIFIDLDWRENPEIALYEARLFDWACRHRNIFPRIYFSGNKGFAIYIDFKPVDIENQFKKPVIRTIIEYIRDRLSLKTLDTQCIDGISRVSRLPNTLHHTSGLYCIPLSRDELWHMDGIKYIQNLAENPSDTPVVVTESECVPQMLLSIQEILRANPTPVPTPRQVVPFLTEQVKPLNTPVKGSPCLGVMEVMAGVQEGVRDVCMCGLIAGLNIQMGLDQAAVDAAVEKWMHTCSPPLLYESATRQYKILEIMNKQYRPCTFLIRAGIKACNTCPVLKK